MEGNYNENLENRKMFLGTKETENNSSEKPKEPEPSTESSGEVIKPGGDKEKNPKKMK